MYYDEYACVTLDGAADERVVGFVLAIPEDHSKWLEKLREADDIEGYNAEDPEDNGLYQRAVVWATQDETGTVVPAYVYHRTGTCKTSRRIWSGDWLDRSSQAQIKRNDKPPPVAPPLKANTAVGTVGTDRGGGRGGRGGGGVGARDGSRRRGGGGGSEIGDRRGSRGGGGGDARDGQPPLPWTKDGYSQPATPDGATPSPIVNRRAGPILITAPHGLRCFRGGKAHGDRRRIHHREKFSTEIALKLSAAIGRQMGFPCSFIVWNMKTAKRADNANLDPNYLLDSQFDRSPWHLALVDWKNACRAAGSPCMHVDFHGKHDPKPKKGSRA